MKSPTWRPEARACRPRAPGFRFRSKVAGRYESAPRQARRELRIRAGGSCAREQKIRNVGAADQQHQPYRAEEQTKLRPQIADQGVERRLHAKSQVAVCIGILLC